MTVSVKWLGHSAFDLNIAGKNVLIDPFLGANSEIKADDLNPDFILITHGHGDHVGDSLAIANRTSAKLIANFEIGDWLTAQGAENATGMNPGGGHDFGFGRVELTIAFHSSSMPDGSYGGQPNGILIFSPDLTIYHAGDTALFSDMKLIGEKGVDLALLPIGDFFTMGPDDSVKAVQFIQPKYVIPMHYNTFPPITQDVEAWADKIRAHTNAEPIVLKINEAKAF